MTGRLPLDSLYLLRSINDLRSSFELRESHVAKTENAERLGLEHATFAVWHKIQHRSFKESNAGLVQLRLKMFGATASTYINETSTCLSGDRTQQNFLTHVNAKHCYRQRNDVFYRTSRGIVCVIMYIFSVQSFVPIY